MNKFTTLAIAALAGLALGSGALAAGMTKAEYKSAKAGIASQFKADKAACKSLTGNARDICQAEAKGKEDVAKAELEQSYKPSAKHQREVAVAKAKAAYGVAKERCDDKAGKDKKACIADARSARKDSMADADRPAARSQRTAVASTTTTSKRQKAGEYVEDSVITGKVKAAVLEEPTLKSAEINVETYKGKVQLSGFVRSRTDINKAVEVARKVEGVKSVDNSMIVKGQQ